MKFGQILAAETVTMLTRVLADHCEHHGIHSIEGRATAAVLLLDHFERGLRQPALLAAALQHADATIDVAPHAPAPFRTY